MSAKSKDSGDTKDQRQERYIAFLEWKVKDREKSLRAERGWKTRYRNSILANR